ncbi:RNA-directed DNA polymerase, eukaryota, Reverse transcriptase zinc-binding domain protein [Artemisia annua]|uniref:RNA-directed DNA polymerase, eukaryota, Reverse transcriptase zinc-binding domain protein n=1 Tax=Artemisia annua TaxID=35608 RepID=A0A2U1L0M3_ARTAN|nr:RNA-directed DNA polymerase, eukaryota, Reverse transcriptase zinc-binding domain protein [Artemisia annua]
MPIDHVKPPDPILEEFCTLTEISSEGLKHSSLHRSDSNLSTKPRGRPKGAKNRVKLKVLSPGSASSGAGAILKRLRKSKVDGKGRSRYESSPLERNGKRPNSCKSPIDDVVAKVLYKIRVSSQMVFREGINDSDLPGKNNVIKDKSNCSMGMNDGFFINTHIEPVATDMEVNRESMEDKVDGIGDCVDPLSDSNNASKLNMADGEHGKDESIRKFDKDGKDVVGGDSTSVAKGVDEMKGPDDRAKLVFSHLNVVPRDVYGCAFIFSLNTLLGVNLKNDCDLVGKICEYDDDVESVKDGMAVEMKPDDGCVNVPDVEVGRKPLWIDLVKQSIVVKDAPWVLLGDFNVILEPSKRSFGSSSITSGMEKFRSCIDNLELVTW